MKPPSQWVAMPKHIFIIENIDRIKWTMVKSWRFGGPCLAPAAFIDGVDITNSLHTLCRRKWLAYPKGIYRWKRHEAQPWVTELGHHAREEFINKQMRDGHVGNT